jgi:hypothetical protein
MCHCFDCQRRTGSAFSVAAFYERNRVHVERGVATSFERQSASGSPVKFHFCDRCGSNVYWEAMRMPHLIGVAVGAFADPSFPSPQQSVWTRDKHCWISLPSEMVQFEVTRAAAPP